MPRLLPTLALLSATMGCAAAAEVDLRLGYGLRSSDADFTQGGATTADDWDSANRITLGVVIQPSPSLSGAFLAGVRAVADLNEVNGSDYTNLALHVQVGYGWTLTPLFRLEVLPYIGLGYADLNTVASGSGSSSSLEFGFDVVGAVTLPSGFQIGASAGYALTRAEPDLSSGSVEIEHDGLVGSIFVGMRL